MLGIGIWGERASAEGEVVIHGGAMVKSQERGREGGRWERTHDHACRWMNLDDIMHGVMLHPIITTGIM